MRFSFSQMAQTNSPGFRCPAALIRCVLLSAISLSVAKSVWAQPSATSSTGSSTTSAPHTAPIAAAGYTIQPLVTSTPFCGVHGLALDAKDQLYAGSVVGQRVYRVDTQSGHTQAVVMPPKGNADDIEFLTDGTMVWTSISQGIVHAQRGNGEIVELATDLVSVNSIAYDEKTHRLFVAQVFGGDALWEIDPAGKRAPREILRDLGGLNGFDIGPDGWIYGPLWFKEKVVKINPDNGEMHTVADGFVTPAAANFDSKNNLYVLDTATGDVVRVDSATGKKNILVTLKTSIDNLAIASDDRIYVSNMADNSIQRIHPDTGVVDTVVAAGLACPLSIATADIAELPVEATAQARTDNQLYIADIFSLRTMNTDTGAITDLARSHAANTPIHYPTAVTINENFLYVMSAGVLQKFSRDNFQLHKEWSDIRQVQAMSAYESDKMVVLHRGGTQLSLFHAQYESKPQTLASEIPNGVAITQVMHDMIYVLVKTTETPSRGAILQVNVSSGETQQVVENLDRPGGIAVTGAGNLVVVVGSPGKVLQINPRSGKQEVLAENIPVGFLYPDLGTQVNGIAIDSNDAIYVIADQTKVIYKLARATQ